MILIGIGSNLASSGYSSPVETAAAAVAALPSIGVEVVVCSRWYLSEPVPVSNQPWFVNAVAAIATKLDPTTAIPQDRGQWPGGRARQELAEKGKHV